MRKNGAVIVTYNRIELLKECIEAIECQEYAFEELIIIDNASTDGTGEYLDQLDSNESGTAITVLHQEKNLGGAGGFYCGMKEAKKRGFDYILIIDDDAIIRKDYMKILMEYIDEHGEIEALAGAVMKEGGIDITHRRRIGSKLLFTEPPVSVAEYDHSFRCETATFCGLLVKGAALDRVGLPKAEYFLWYDDTEFSLRLDGIVVVPEAILDHKTTAAQSTGNLFLRNWKHYYGYRNRYDTARIHFGRCATFMVAVEYFILTMASAFLLFFPSFREQARFNIRMINDALNDGKNEQLGFNPNYHL